MTFYKAFLRDLDRCREEVIIESPFITASRMKTFDRIFTNLINRGVKIYIITRDPSEHDNGYEIQSEMAIQWCEEIGIQILLCNGNHHRKILWEGSLNILSQLNTREIMRRIDSVEASTQMFNFLQFKKCI